MEYIGRFEFVNTYSWLIVSPSFLWRGTLIVLGFKYQVAVRS